MIGHNPWSQDKFYVKVLCFVIRVLYNHKQPYTNTDLHYKTCFWWCDLPHRPRKCRVVLNNVLWTDSIPGARRNWKYDFAGWANFRGTNYCKNKNMAAVFNLKGTIPFYPSIWSWLQLIQHKTRCYSQVVQCRHWWWNFLRHGLLQLPIQSEWCKRQSFYNRSSGILCFFITSRRKPITNWSTTRSTHCSWSTVPLPTRLFPPVFVGSFACRVCFPLGLTILLQILFFFWGYPTFLGMRLTLARLLPSFRFLIYGKNALLRPSSQNAEKWSSHWKRYSWIIHNIFLLHNTLRYSKPDFC